MRLSSSYYSGTGLYTLSADPLRTSFRGTGDEGMLDREPVSPWIEAFEPGRGEGQADEELELAIISCNTVEFDSTREGRVEFACC